MKILLLLLASFLGAQASHMTSRYAWQPWKSGRRITNSELMKVRRRLIEFYQDNKQRIEDADQHDPIIPKAIRLTSHDCMGSSICDGCVHISHPDNAGLETVYRMLVTLYEAKGTMQYGKSIKDVMGSYADFFVYASIVGMEMARDPENNGKPNCYIPQIFPFRAGRFECPQAPDGPSTTTFPDPSGGFKKTTQFFKDRFNFTPNETLAILSIHTMGRMTRGNSGFEGVWADEPDKFDNYWCIHITGKQWRQINVARDFEKVRWQWNGDDSTPNPPTDRTGFTMLNADICLHRDIHPNKDGKEENFSCRRDIDNCGLSPTAPFMVECAADETFWLKKFKLAFTKLTEKGHGRLYIPA